MAEDAVSPSTARLITGAVTSVDVLGPQSAPVEALAAVHYFATSIDKPPTSVRVLLSMPKKRYPAVAARYPDVDVLAILRDVK